MHVTRARTVRVWLIANMAAAAVIVAAASIGILYRAAYNETLREMAHSAQLLANLMQAVAEFDQEYSAADIPGGSRAATLLQIQAALAAPDDASSATLVIGELGRNGIRLIRKGVGGGLSERTIPISDFLQAEPLRRALAGESGSDELIDNEGNAVLAGYAPVPALRLGICYTVDKAAVQAPYVHAAANAAVIALLVILAGSFVFVRFMRPLQDRIDASEQKSAAILSAIPDLMFRINRQGVYLDFRAPNAAGSAAAEEYVIGRSIHELLPADVASLSLKHVQNTLVTGEVSVFEYSLEVPAGVRHLEARVAWGAPDEAVVMVRDVSERRRVGDLLKFIAQREWIGSGREFLPALAERLGQELRVAYVIIDRLAEEPGSVDTVALFAEGSISSNIRYELAGTPCENVFERGLCLYSKNVQALFPEDRLLVDMKAESYLGMPLWDSTGKAIGLIAVLDTRPIQDPREATALLRVVATAAGAELERLRELKKLRKERDRAQGYLDTVEAIILALDKNGKIVGINRKGCEVLGRSEAELLGANWFEKCLPAPEGMEVVYPYFLKLMKGELASIEYYENSVVTRFGGHRTIAWHTALTYGESGEVIGTLSAGEDITERKLAEEQLQGSQRFAQRIVETVPGALYVLDLSTNGLVFDRRSVGSLVRRRDEDDFFPGNPAFMEAIHPADRANFIHMRRALEDISAGTVVECEYRIGHGTDAVWLQNWETVFLKDADGKPIQILGVAQDVTARKTAEEELVSKNEELERLMYTVSHDLRSPVVTVQSFAGFALEGLEKGDTVNVAKDLASVQRAARRMDSLLSELLRFSQSGRRPEASFACSLAEVVRDAVDLCAARIALRKVQVLIRDLPGSVRGDRWRLVSLFQNLIDNAVKFMGQQQEPSIELGSELIKAERTYFVRDNGIGVEARYLGRLFMLFEKLNPEMEGIGMGLSIAQRIVEAHGGRIRVASEGLGLGTTVYFTLPDA